MKDLLAVYYDIHVDDSVMLDGKECFKNNEYYYFTILADNREVIQMEQAALAYYLTEQNIRQTAIPIPNVHGEWFSNYQDDYYMVLRFQLRQEREQMSHGMLLGKFHKMGSMYRYEPQEISSYGQWKELWINKLTAYESNIVKSAKENSSQFDRFMMDILPYIIGISENAIQYVQESEQDNRFHEGDQGTISFRRYNDNMIKPVLWFDDLVYDHPARDIAEYIRYKLLDDGEKASNEAAAFVHQYQSVQPLSVFSWRLLYARLLFPIHLFDQIERCYSYQNIEQSYREMAEILEQQTIYERRLANFFEIAGVDYESLQIPVLHWL
ncbi:hypothetical protein [Virgibacillus oceani]|uniref:Spore coat protein YutH n=1 Tax=Virgibacillus oceani TaxID=1479511 RepID=A0A917H3G1_9BACI|nr:hypothetical protein [Virgibacillus oceani]GGG66381.1 spore coat protein YutH [Virgibacillus oceani]